MNKLIIAIAALSTVAATTLYFKAPKTSGIRIAILLPAVHPAMQAYTVDTFNAGGNKTLLRAQADEIANGQYDLVFTVGMQCSHTMHTLLTSKQINSPLVFCAIDNPQTIAVTSETRKAGDNTTGVYIADNFDVQLSYLLKVKPTTKTILFVYDPTHGSGMNNVVRELKAASTRAGLTLRTAEVFATSEISQKVESLLTGIDALLIYTDHTTVSGVDCLIKLANQYGVTLYASDLNSGHKGAALSFGVQEYDHGKEGALKALTILDDYKLARDVPITAISNYKLLINKATQHAQSLNLSDEQLSKLTQNANILIKEAL